MEKKNIMTREEFKHFETIDAMYDMYLSVVTGFNRLVDICNDSSERIAELVIERDELIERHTVYTNALNKDLADKAAKINLLEKEIEGRKEGYTALKKRMDTDYISINEHNNIIDPLNKEIESLKKSFNALKEEMATRYITIETHNIICETYDNKIAELEKELADRNVKIRHQKENLDGINKTLEIRTKENESLVKVRNNLNKEIEAHEEENARLSERIIELKGTITELSHEIDNYKSWNASLHKDIKSEINNKNDLVDAYEKKYDEFEKKIAELERQNEYLTKELNESYKAWDTDSKNHSKRDMTLVDELGKKNDKIKALVQETDYYKEQERIRTDQLRATESKVEELYKQIEGLKRANRIAINSVYGIASASTHEEEDYGKSGFKRYIEHLIEEEERAVPERFKARLNEEITAIFTKEEETIKYRPSEIDRFTNFLKDEVDKKRIVDIGEGAEKILGVSRELFDAAIKALVDDGYQEIIGRIPQATNSYAYMDMHVLATPDVETKETANAENIKSLDFDIPCGEDAIE